MAKALNPELMTASDMLEGEVGAHPWRDGTIAGFNYT
jgi:hypothetical protein